MTPEKLKEVWERFQHEYGYISNPNQREWAAWLACAQEYEKKLEEMEARAKREWMEESLVLDAAEQKLARIGEWLKRNRGPIANKGIGVRPSCELDAILKGEE